MNYSEALEILKSVRGKVRFLRPLVYDAVHRNNLVRLDNLTKDLERVNGNFKSAVDFLISQNNYRRMNKSMEMIWNEGLSRYYSIKIFDEMKRAKENGNEPLCVGLLAVDKAVSGIHGTYVCGVSWLNDFYPEWAIKPENEQSTTDAKKASQKAENGLQRVEELRSVKAKAILKRAVDVGLCSCNDGVWRWKRSKSLLAYFAAKMSDILNLGYGMYGNQKKVSWKPFETLFGVDGLVLSMNDIKKTGENPKGYEIVDKLFWKITPM